MKIVASGPEHSFLIDSEDDVISHLQEVRKWTDCIPQRYDIGIVEASFLKDHIYTMTQFIEESTERYFGKRMYDIDPSEISVIFLTMPYYNKGNFLHQLSRSLQTGDIIILDDRRSDDILGFFFELYYTLVVLGINEIRHGDLNAGKASGLGDQPVPDLSCFAAPVT